jgi:hypothetical protein
MLPQPLIDLVFLLPNVQLDLRYVLLTIWLTGAVIWCLHPITWR